MDRYATAFAPRAIEISQETYLPRRDVRRLLRVVSALLLLGAFLIGLLVSAEIAGAEDPLLLASTLWSSAYAVRTCDDVAIVLFGGGLATFDVTDPTEPVLIKRFDRSVEFWTYQSIEVAGGLIYMAGGDGLGVYDFADPTQPILVGACDIPGEAYDLRIMGDLLYIAGGYSSGLGIFDITEPATPELLGGCGTPGGCFAVALDATGQYAYIADGMGGIAIVDVHDPRLPQLLDSIYNMPYPPFDIDVEGDHLYSIGCQGEDSSGGSSSSAPVAGERTPWDPSGLSIHDISDPLAPMHRGTYDSDQGTNRLRVRKSLAYIANANGTLSVVDVSNASSPTLVAQVAVGGYSRDLHLLDDRAYITASQGSLLILDVSVPALPELLGRWWEADGCYDVSARDGLACVADRSYGLHLIDAADPHDPRVLSHFELPDGPWAVITDGRYAFVAADSAGVFVLDVTDPEVPAVVAHVGVYSNDLDFDGRYLYSVSWTEELHVIDAIDPRHPVLDGSLSLPGRSWSISVRNGYGCVTASSDLCVIDLRDPAHPVMRGLFDPQEYIHQVSFDGTYAYASLGNNGLYVVDCSDPDAPTYVAELRFDGNTRGSRLDGDRLYLGAAGLQVIDVADPEHPQVVGSAPTRGTMHVCIDEDLAFTADSGSLGIFRVGQTAHAPAPPKVTPPCGPELMLSNPVRGTAEVLLRTARQGPVSLELLDVQGRRAALLYDGPAPTGELHVSWNATHLPAGRYCLHARTPAGGATRSVIVLR